MKINAVPTYRAVKPWQVHYPDPIRGAAGDRLTLGRRDDEFPGWVWATPAELPLEPGDVVSGDLVESGWLWAAASDGRAGWVPLDNLELVRRAGRSPADPSPIPYKTNFSH